MTVEEKISEKFKALLAEGKTILERSGWNGREYRTRPDGLTYSRFRTESLNLIGRSCGKNSDHYEELKKLADQKDHSGYHFKECYGILEAASRDYEGGMLFDIRSMVTAEVFDDFLEQAEHLFTHNYFLAAASLAGAVLEDALRTLSKINNITVPDKTTIDKLNIELARAQVYDKLIQKRITGIADIRNNADHGHFDKVKKDDVEDMLKWVRRFSADFLK